MTKVSISVRKLIPAVLLVSLLAACTTSATPTESPTATEVPATAVSTEAPTATTAPEVQVTDTGNPAPEAANTRLNLNTASGDDFLAAIPGFSSRMLREFLEYRPYISIQQFRKEIGKYVDEAQVAKYELYVFVPISVDDSDAATLMQIPGLDEAAAAALIADRPFGSNKAFLATLAEVAPAVDPAVALGYLASE